MSEQNSSPIHSNSNHHDSNNAENSETLVASSSKNEISIEKKNLSKNNGSRSSNNNAVVRRERPSRACTQRAAERMQAAARAEAELEVERKRKRARKRERLAALLKEENDDDEEEEGVDKGDEDNVDEDGGSPSSSRPQSSRMITPLVGDLEASQLPRWNIRSMWQLASILNFLNVFRPLLNINVEFSAEELETALLTPNNTLADVHMPLLKSIPPIIRMALGPGTWITVLCRKLRHWWHWVAEGDLPIVAAHGAEIEAYHALDPGVRVLILKALCDIRVEQEDIKLYIDDSIKHGAPLSSFRKQRIGGDSGGVSYWYEDDPIIGHRLYREIRKVEINKGKGKSVPQIPHSSYHWEAIATNLDEFTNVSEKLFASSNKTEVSVGKKLKNDMLPEIEKVHKRKEKLLKKQHREALMLNSIMHMDGIAAGRSLRDRKPVTYTFDDYDRSINEALKFNKNRQQFLEPFERRDPHVKFDNPINGRWAGTLRSTRHDTFSAPSPMSPEEDELYDDQKTEYDDDHQENETLDRSNRRRQRPQRYSENDFTEAISDNEAAYLESDDDDIVGEVVYDEEYLRRRKQRRKASSGSEGDEEYKWDGENLEEEDDDEEEEEDNNSLSASEDSDERPRKSRTMRGRTRRETRLRSVHEIETGLRRSKRSTRNRVNYKLYEMSESDNESMKPHKYLAEQSDAIGDGDDPLTGKQESEEKIDEKDTQHTDHHFVDYQPSEEKHMGTMDDNKEETDNEKPQDSVEDEEDKGLIRKRRFLDLNELAPSSGFDSTMDDDPSGF